MKQIKNHSLAFIQAFGKLLFSPHFILLTLLGNLIVLIFASAFYWAEVGLNPLVDEKMDALWWAFSTVTTVGYGDIVPDTVLGRVLGIILMLIGTGLFACYVALISETFMSIELKRAVKIKSLKED